MSREWTVSVERTQMARFVVKAATRAEAVALAENASKAVRFWETYGGPMLEFRPKCWTTREWESAVPRVK